MKILSAEHQCPARFLGSCIILYPDRWEPGGSESAAVNIFAHLKKIKLFTWKKRFFSRVSKFHLKRIKYGIE